ncbi:hypothetical protein BC833DRAFT_617633 [Globomyces pollinis-pini]|nr:hypothetical protein BC833DRAFT_617633 [Globomyces pollinis-pini]
MADPNTYFTLDEYSNVRQAKQNMPTPYQCFGDPMKGTNNGSNVGNSKEIQTQGKMIMINQIKNVGVSDRTPIYRLVNSYNSITSKRGMKQLNISQRIEQPLHKSRSKCQAKQNWNNVKERNHLYKDENYTENVPELIQDQFRADFAAMKSLNA